MSIRTKNHINHPVDRPKNVCCFRHGFTKLCSSYRVKCTSEKCIFFEMLGLLICALCFLLSAARSSQKKIMDQGVRNQGFCDHLAHFEAQRARNVGTASVTKQQVFPRVIYVCGAGCVCGECQGVSCQLRVNDVFFCAVSLSGSAAKSHDHCSKKPPLAATQALACGPKHYRSSRSSHGPRPGRSRMLIELHFVLVPQKEV